MSDWHDLPSLDAHQLCEFGLRFDCTALVARDPWHDGMPLVGMVRVRGAEGGARRIFIGARERSSYREASARRETTTLECLRTARWRTALLHERDGRASLHIAFGVRA